MAKKDYNDEDGVWRTIGGRKVFIRKGQNLADAMIESGKFKTNSKGGMRENWRKEKEKDLKEEENIYEDLKDTGPRTDENTKEIDEKQKNLVKKFRENHELYPAQKVQSIDMDEKGMREKYREEQEQQRQQSQEKERERVAKYFKDQEERALEQKDWGYRYSKETLQKMSDEDLNNYIDRQSKLYNEYSNETNPFDKRTYNGKMRETFNKSMATNYEYGLKEAQEELDRRNKSTNNKNKSYDVDMSDTTTEEYDKRSKEIGFPRSDEHGNYRVEKNGEYEYKMYDKIKNPFRAGHDSNFYKNLSNEEKKQYNDYIDKGYSQSEIENTLMYKTQDQRMREAGIEFASEEEVKGLQKKANEINKANQSTNETMNQAIREKASNTGFTTKSTNPMYSDTNYTTEEVKKLEEAGKRPMENSYSGRGWEGVNSNKNLSTSDTAKEITKSMKEKYPDVKIARKSDNYSMGSSIDFNIMSSDKDLYISDKDIDKMSGDDIENILRSGENHYFDRWANTNVNGYKENRQFTDNDVKRYLKDDLKNIKSRSENQNVRGNEYYLSDYGKKVVSDLNKTANSYTYDDSDAMSDYFDHGTYMHVSIGKWNKPYEVNNKSSNKYDRKYNSMDEVIADKDSALNQHIRNKANEKKAYRQYLKDHPESKMSLKDFRNMKK